MHSREGCTLTPASACPSSMCLECLLPWKLRGVRRLPTPLPGLQLQQELLLGGHLPGRLVPLLALLLRLPQLLQQGLSWCQGGAQPSLLWVLLVLVALPLQLLLLLKVVQQQGPLMLLVRRLLLRGGLLGWRLLLLLLQALQQQTALLLGGQACTHGNFRVWRRPGVRGRAAAVAAWCCTAEGFSQLGIGQHWVHALCQEAACCQDSKLQLCLLTNGS